VVFATSTSAGSGHGRELAAGLSAAFGVFLIVRGLLNAS
jgi:hypothetical protein